MPARPHAPALMAAAGLAAALVVAPLTAAAAAPTDRAAAPAAAPAAALADPDIDVAKVRAHLDRLSAIAAANGGNRATGRSGYQASVDYVKATLDAAGYTTQVQSFSTSSGTSYNVVATLAGTDPSRVVMAGAHLDSVSAGPGINDNGSGTAGVLETAVQYAASGQRPRNTLRFGFWGAEEQGLLGSKAYVASLSAAEKAKIALYLNIDMIGSPNPGYFVYDDNAAGNAVRDEITAWYTAKGIPSEYIDVQGRSDHAAFRAAGLPTAGIFSGAETLKTTAQAQKWGGTAGRAFDPCYHRSCDTLANLDTTSLDRGADLVGAIVTRYAAKDYGTTIPPTVGNLLQNAGFESGATVWTGTAGPITNSASRPARTGSWKLWLGGNGSAGTETVNQTVTVPSTATAAALTFWLRTDTAETGTTVYDTMRAQVVDGSTVTTLGTFSNVAPNATYTQKSFSLLPWKGRAVTIRFTATEDSSAQTSFVVDDTAVTVG
ncbi:M28 family metallopeptidase [Phycicoccus avicenniae]|uniref:M28 family metallopeptidase n=1 Tax=Phycicoccus avicenniae TaxID=2828860 RepID=UPI003D2828F2